MERNGLSLATVEPSGDLWLDRGHWEETSMQNAPAGCGSRNGNELHFLPRQCCSAKYVLLHRNELVDCG
jgi:hypothetical protein